MSRIHEALKRAEQERGNPIEAVSLKDPSASAMSARQNASPSLAVPFLASEFSFDALIDRCPQNHWSPDLMTMLFFNSTDQVHGTEEFRTLRSRLYQLRENQPLKKILVTSALPREGKSFVAANLAQVLVRQHGRRVLLIDGDLRASRLHIALGTPPAPGLVEYLMGEIDEFAIMQRGPMENLFFVSSGRTISNPAELVANGRMRLLLDRVESIFDWVIIDSPPAVPVSDAGLIANTCDGVLMVVRSQATPFDIARKALKDFRVQQLVGVVLNAIEARSMPYSQYYYPAYGRPSGKTAAQR